MLHPMPSDGPHPDDVDDNDDSDDDNDVLLLFPYTPYWSTSKKGYAIKTTKKPKPEPKQDWYESSACKDVGKILEL